VRAQRDPARRPPPNLTTPDREGAATPFWTGPGGAGQVRARRLERGMDGATRHAASFSAVAAAGPMEEDGRPPRPGNARRRMPSSLRNSAVWSPVMPSAALRQAAANWVAAGTGDGHPGSR
jgi:hypothetical protein